MRTARLIARPWTGARLSAMSHYPIARVVNLIPAESQRLWSVDEAQARRRLLGGDPDAVLGVDGSFALVAQDGERVVLARTLDRPMRYFLAKAADGPVLIVAERIDAIAAELARRGWAGQFHASYTRMVPAHHVTTLRLVGCPDPNPVHRRFFDPPRGTLPEDLDVIGHQYISALYDELRRCSACRTRPRRSACRSPAASTAAPCCSRSISCS